MDLFKISFNHTNVLAFIVIILSGSSRVSAQMNNSDSRCYSFTWLGPRFNSDSLFENATCQDATQLSAGVPCFQPLVVSLDGSWPDVDYIWEHHRERASCILADNDVCAQFTYYFDGRPENSTYMCTRAVDTRGAAVTSGCYSQIVGSATTRVCFCRSLSGRIPCNNAFNDITPSLKILSLVSAFLTLFYCQHTRIL